MKTYKITVVIDYDAKYVKLDRACGIAFQSGKGFCGCGFSDKNITEFYVFGKFCDYVRVCSALKNNGFKIISKRGNYGVK